MKFKSNFKIPQNEVIIEESGNAKSASLRIIGNPTLSPNVIVAIGDSSCVVDSTRLISSIHSVLWPLKQSATQANDTMCDFVDILETIRFNSKEAEEWASMEADEVVWSNAVQDVSAMTRVIEILKRKLEAKRKGRANS